LVNVVAVAFAEMVVEAVDVAVVVVVAMKEKEIKT
jgi:hypothetical protein